MNSAIDLFTTVKGFLRIPLSGTLFALSSVSIACKDLYLTCKRFYVFMIRLFITSTFSVFAVFTGKRDNLLTLFFLYPVFD